MKLKYFIGSLLIALFGAVTAVTATSCGAEPTIGDANWVDYVKNGTVKLGLDHKNRSFWTDGVEEVTLKSSIDGDTAHFTTSTGATLKARFYGVNTPESTGEIQEYGKEASNFTKKKLEEAAKNGTIVVSSAQSSYGTPNPDSTGSRYVSLVWINLDTKNADRDHLYLLNLWIVQEGYSWVKNVNDMPEYVDTFIAAENQAKNYKLNLFSGKPAPLFNYGSYEDTSLLDIKHEVEETLKDPDHVNRFNGSKCRVVGTVAGYSNNILYIQNFYADDPDDPTKGGEYASLNIFCGMTTIPVRFYTINTYIEICGVCTDSENFGFQMSGVHFPKTSSSTGPDDARVIIKAEDNTGEFSLHRFEYTAAELQSKVEAKSTEALNCAIQVTDFVEVKKDRGYTSEDGDITIYTAAGWGIYITFGYQATEVDVYDNHTYFQGKKIKVAGVMGIHKTTSGSYQWQVIPSNSADIQLMD